MSSPSQNHQWHLLTYVSNRSKVDKELQNEEKLDDNDLEVAMINESFEEQLKHLLQPTGPKPDETSEHNMEMTSIFPPITPPSDQEFDRGQQLDRELERMMCEDDVESYRLSFISPISTHAENFYSEDTSLHHQLTASFTLSPFLSVQNQSNKLSFACQLGDEQNNDESDAAAKSIAYDVISSLFDEEPLFSSESISDDDESMVVNSSILQVLQDDETESELEENTETMKESEIEESVKKESESLEFQLALSSRNNSVNNILSPIYTSDEQTVPVFDSWEELGDSPVAAEKVYSEAKAVLRKIRAERKATQL